MGTLQILLKAVTMKLLVLSSGSAVRSLSFAQNSSHLVVKDPVVINC